MELTLVVVESGPDHVIEGQPTKGTKVKQDIQQDKFCIQQVWKEQILGNDWDTTILFYIRQHYQIFWNGLDLEQMGTSMFRGRVGGMCRHDARNIIKSIDLKKNVL